MKTKERSAECTEKLRKVDSLLAEIRITLKENRELLKETCSAVVITTEHTHPENLEHTIGYTHTNCPDKISDLMADEVSNAIRVKRTAMMQVADLIAQSIHDKYPDAKSGKSGREEMYGHFRLAIEKMLQWKDWQNERENG